MKNYLPILLLLTLIYSASLGQKQYDNWYFGRYRAMKFTNSGVVPITGSPLISAENCSSISDSSGNLLFFTNGEFIWDRNHNLMPNGLGLLGWGDVQQGVLIVPLPNNNNVYYVFTIGNPTGPYTKELRYSVVDMTLNNLLGDVSQKNILLDVDVTEKLTATLHANGQDFWIVEHPFTSNKFKSFLLNSNGLDTIPVTSIAGLNPSTISFTGGIKISNNGCWLISTIRSPISGKLELFHFDNNTGIVSGNAFLNFSNPYGLEFSPNSNRFYVSRNATSPIFQFDLTAGNDSLILQSGIPISDTIQGVTLSMQLAPDNKIYFVTASDSTIGAIRQPDLLGFNCDVNEYEIYFTDTISSNSSSLPNLFNLLYTGTLTCSPQTNIDFVEPENLSISFPNPFTNQLTFQMFKNEPTTVSLYNSLSQLIFQIPFTKSVAINTEHLAKGIYFYNLRSNNATLKTGKVVKQ